MPAYARNDIETLYRVVGNLEPIGFQLQDIDGNNLNIIGKTLKFRMVLIAGGTVKINNAACVIDTAADGLGHYQPTGTDFDTAGEYAAYVIDDDTVDRRFPYDGARWIIRVIAETAQQ